VKEIRNGKETRTNFMRMNVMDYSLLVGVDRQKKELVSFPKTALEPPSGGHISHGSPSGKVSGTSIFFESLSYWVNPQTGYIDYENLEERAKDFHTKILMCGGSSYYREWDFAWMRLSAAKCGAVLMCDPTHICELVATTECCSPFD
ncbi:hypothetical protein E2562_000117, partial [Oryza meyeriana var. granulata]